MLEKDRGPAQLAQDEGNDLQYDEQSIYNGPEDAGRLIRYS